MVNSCNSSSPTFEHCSLSQVQPATDHNPHWQSTPQFSLHAAPEALKVFAQTAFFLTGRTLANFHGLLLNSEQQLLRLHGVPLLLSNTSQSEIEHSSHLWATVNCNPHWQSTAGFSQHAALGALKVVAQTASPPHRQDSCQFSLFIQQ